MISINKFKGRIFYSPLYLQLLHLKWVFIFSGLSHIISVRSYAQDTIAPLSTEQAYREHRALNPTDTPIADMFKRDFVATTNQLLHNEGHQSLENLEILELENIIEDWLQPIQTSVILYLCVFALIVGHALYCKHYKWGFAMLFIGAISTPFIWIAPISYTRRHILKESMVQQVPIVLIQILPTLVWWTALGDLAQWYERIARSRGL